MHVDVDWQLKCSNHPALGAACRSQGWCHDRINTLRKDLEAQRVAVLVLPRGCCQVTG